MTALFLLSPLLLVATAPALLVPIVPTAAIIAPAAAPVFDPAAPPSWWTEKMRQPCTKSGDRIVC